MRFTLLIAAVLGICISALAAEQMAGDDLLKSKNLSKTGAYYLLDVDAKLPQSMRDIRRADALMNVYTQRRHYLSDEIEKTRNAQIKWGEQMHDLDQREAQTSNAGAKNNLIFQYNQLLTATREGDKYIQKCQADLRLLQVPPDSLDLSLRLLQKMESASKEYDTLTNDDAVKNALDQINKSSTIKFHLGPSAVFKSELQTLQREHEKLTAAPITLDFTESVPRVNVTLNGSVTHLMVFDSGASVVTLTHDIAKELDLHPGINDTKITLIDANGKHTDCYVMKLKSVRVGPFAVGDVECAILPAGEKAECLLGGTFLRNFLYRMDLGTGQLFLTPLSTATPVAEAKVSDSKPTTKPGVNSGTMLEIHATVDGAEAIMISSAGLKWSHRDAAWATDVSINGADWDPQANDSLPSNESLTFLKKADFSKARGRKSRPRRGRDATLRRRHRSRFPRSALERAITKLKFPSRQNKRSAHEDRSHHHSLDRRRSAGKHVALLRRPARSRARGDADHRAADRARGIAAGAGEKLWISRGSFRGDAPRDSAAQGLANVFAFDSAAARDSRRMWCTRIRARPASSAAGRRTRRGCRSSCTRFTGLRSPHRHRD